MKDTKNKVEKENASGKPDVVFSASQNMPILEREIKKEITPLNNDWIPMGTDNAFPQAVAELVRKTTSLRSIINWKRLYCAGTGFNEIKNNKQIDELIKKANPKETLRSIVKKFFYDRFSFGNNYIEIVITKGGINLYHKDYTTCRLSKDKKRILIHGDWLNISKYKKETIKSLPLFPEFEEIDGAKRSVYHLKDYEPEFNSYGLAQWIGALDAAGIAYKTNKWNLSRLDNSFNSSGVLIVEGNVTPKQAKELKKQFKDEMTGEQNQGKIMFVVKQLGGANTSFTPITTTNEGDWIELRKESKSDLIEANNWFRSLCSYNDNTGFDTNRIRNEYQVAMNTVIAEEQEIFLEVIKDICNTVTSVKIDASELSFKNKAPIAMFDIDIDSIVQFGEARAMLNLPVDEKDERHKITLSEIQARRYKKNGTNTTSN